MSLPPAGPRLLIASSRPDLLDLLQLSLAAAGYQVTTATCGATADRALQGGGFAGAVVDNHMSVMTGAEVLAAAAARGDGTPVLLLSSSHLASSVPASVRPAGVLGKPFRITDLLTAVASLVAGG